MFPTKFLHPELSEGYNEHRRGEFADYSQADMDVKFLMALIVDNEEITKHVCIPKGLSCFFHDANGDVAVESSYECSDKIPAGIIVIGAMTDTPKLLYPSQLEDNVRECIEQNNFVIFNFGVYTEHSYSQGHSNGLVINKKTNTIERWESHGTLEFEKYNNNIKNVFKSDPWLKSFDYVQIISVIGPQDRADMFEGLCVTYSTMFVIVRLSNPNASPTDIYNSILQLNDYKLLRYVLRFNKFMIETLKKHPMDSLFHGMKDAVTIPPAQLQTLRTRVKKKTTPLGRMLKESIHVTGKSFAKTTVNYLYESLSHILEHPDYKQWWRRGARESLKSLEFLDPMMSPIIRRKKQRFFSMLL